MTKHTQTSLRARLRADTRISHEELDKKVSGFDLTTPEGLLSFLRMQSSALQVFSVLQLSENTEILVRDLLDRAASDLRGFGAAPRKSVFEIEPVHPLASEYVLAGSRLGTQILRKRWHSATNPQVRRANAYFSAPNYIGMWASFCDTTESMPSNGQLADQIVSDADRIFQFYLDCARTAHIEIGAIHA